MAESPAVLHHSLKQVRCRDLREKSVFRGDAKNEQRGFLSVVDAR